MKVRTIIYNENAKPHEDDPIVRTCDVRHVPLTPPFRYEMEKSDLKKVIHKYSGKTVIYELIEEE